MKVLILTISAGQGHNQTAHAIEEYLISQGAECRILDAYKYISTVLGESVERGYLITTQYTPMMYGGFYRLAEKKEKARHKKFSMLKFTNSIMGKKLRQYIEEYNPDVVVSTHIFAAISMTYLSVKLPKIINIGIITDFTVHPFWEDTDLDYYVTATPLLNLQCKKKGITGDRILPIGIPIHSKFSKHIDKSEARRKLGIDEKPTVLIMMGSMGYGNVSKVVRKIDTLNIDLQMLCVCGKNKRAKRNVESLSTNHNVFTYGFIDNVDVMMDAADFIVTKPGGLTISESLAKGLPAILVNPIPGQEDRNLEFLLNNGLAMSISSTFTIDEAVYQMLSNEWRNKNLSEGVRYIGRPNSSKDLGDFIMNLKKVGD